MSEAGKYATLFTSIEEDDGPASYKQLYIWLLSISPELSRSGFRGIRKVQPSFSKALSELEEVLIDAQ